MLAAPDSSSGAHVRGLENRYTSGSDRRSPLRITQEQLICTQTRSLLPRSVTFSNRVRSVHSFRATSGPVIRLRSGNVEAMIASEAASPPRTVAQYAIPGIRNAMPTWELR